MNVAPVILDIFSLSRAYSKLFLKRVRADFCNFCTLRVEMVNNG